MEDINSKKLNYNPKAQVPFSDPVVTCDSCQELVQRETIKKVGACSACGNRRFRNVLVLNEANMAKCKEWGIDPDFLALFEQVNTLTPHESADYMKLPEGISPEEMKK